MFVARYNADGTLAWAKLAGGSGGTTEAFSISAVAGGGCVISGAGHGGSTTFGAGEANETTLDFFNEVFVARYNPNGTLAWAKKGGAGEGRAIHALADGSSLVAGYGSGTFGEGEAGETYFPSSQFFIARLRPDGTLLWAKGDSVGVRELDISAASDGSVLVAGGMSYGFATFGDGEPHETVLPVELSPYADIFIARYNADGGF